MLVPQIFKNYEISKNVTDKNTKFTSKIEDIVICGSCEIFIYNVYNGNLHVYCMFTFCSIYQNCSEVTVFMILFHVSESNA